MNILILSAGTRNKLVNYFKKAVAPDGKIVVTDMSLYAPAIYEGDKYYIVPRATDPGYVDIILDICKKEDIDGVISLIDPELSVISERVADFEKIGTKLCISSYEKCELAFDKIKMYKWLCEHNYKCARSYFDIDEFFADKEKGLISYPVFVKPVKGSASINISVADDDETVRLLYRKNSGLMIQEYMCGQEIGADIYIDMISDKVVSVFTKKKLKMRAGETDKAVSFKDEKLFALIERFAEEAGFSSEIDMDIFDVDGEYYISEVNPRFGGGFPHAYECGCKNTDLLVNNLNGIVNEKNIGNYKDNVYMMKYNEIMIK